jgi:hypothetical protein
MAQYNLDISQFQYKMEIICVEKVEEGICGLQCNVPIGDTYECTYDHTNKMMVVWRCKNSVETLVKIMDYIYPCVQGPPKMICVQKTDSGICGKSCDLDDTAYKCPDKDHKGYIKLALDYTEPIKPITTIAIEPYISTPNPKKRKNDEEITGASKKRKTDEVVEHD